MKALHHSYSPTLPTRCLQYVYQCIGHAPCGLHATVVTTQGMCIEDVDAGIVLTTMVNKHGDRLCFRMVSHHLTIAYMHYHATAPCYCTPSCAPSSPFADIPDCRARHKGGGYSALINTNDDTPAAAATIPATTTPAADTSGRGVGDEDEDAMYYDGIDDDLLPLQAPEPVVYGHAKTFRAALVVRAHMGVLVVVDDGQ